MSGTATVDSTAIKPGDVHIEEGFNPRGEVDVKSAEYAELRESISEVGVLQSILVTRAEGDKFRLIAGERRLRVAQELALDSIPAQVVAADEDEAFAMATTENLQREQLNPLQQALAIKRLSARKSTDEIAKMLGFSKDWVRERSRLLNLGDAAAKLYAEGKLPLGGLAAVEKLALVNRAAADAVAKWAVEHRDGNLRTDDEVADALLAQRRRAKGFVVIECTLDSNHGDGYRFTAGESEHSRFYAPLPKKALAKLQKLWDAVPAHPHANYYTEQVRLGKPAIDAAKAFGCLYSTGRRGFEATNVILDADFAVDQFEQEIERMRVERQKLVEAEAAKKAKKSGPTASAGELSPEEKKAEREAKAANRQKEVDARAASHARNLELGANCRRKLATTKPTADALRLMLLLSGRDAGGWWSRLAYTDSELHTEEWKVTKHQEKNGLTGTVKVKIDAEAVEKYRAAQLKKAKTPGAIAGLYLRLAIAARFVDVGVSLQPDKPLLEGAVKPRGEYVYDGDEILKLVDKIALDLKVLPEAMREIASKKLGAHNR